MKSTIFDQMRAELETSKDRSAWDRGVTLYAFDLVDNLQVAAEYNGRLPAPGEELRITLLNGADNWSQYSWDGSALIYDCDIVARLCCPSMFRKTRGGERKPNAREEWLDVQARALAQAARRISRLYWRVVKQ